MWTSILRRSLATCILVYVACAPVVLRAAEPTPTDSSVQQRWVFFEPGSSVLPKGARQALQSLAEEIGNQAIVTVAGEAEASLNLAMSRAQAVSEALQTSGISKDRLVSVISHTPQQATSVQWTVPALTTARPRSAARASPEGRALPTYFDILLSDGHLAVTLMRWARIHGYRLEWATPIQVPVRGDLTLDATGFSDALDQVMSGLRKAGYPLSARQTDKLIRITNSS
jgi:hypothetical protein